MNRKLNIRGRLHSEKPDQNILVAAIHMTNDT